MDTEITRAWLLKHVVNAIRALALPFTKQRRLQVPVCDLRSMLVDDFSDALWHTRAWQREQHVEVLATESMRDLEVLDSLLSE